MRIARLIMGLLITIQGFYTQQWLGVILGIGFSLLPILNLGCGCDGSYCTTPTKERKYD